VTNRAAASRGSIKDNGKDARDKFADALTSAAQPAKRRSVQNENLKNGKLHFRNKSCNYGYLHTSRLRLYTRSSRMRDLDLNGGPLIKTASLSSQLQFSQQRYFVISQKRRIVKILWRKFYKNFRRERGIEWETEERRRRNTIWLNNKTVAASQFVKWNWCSRNGRARIFHVIKDRNGSRRYIPGYILCITTAQASERETRERESEKIAESAGVCYRM